MREGKLVGANQKERHMFTHSCFHSGPTLTDSFYHLIIVLTNTEQACMWVSMWRNEDAEVAHREHRISWGK